MTRKLAGIFTGAGLLLVLDAALWTVIGLATGHALVHASAVAPWPPAWRSWLYSREIMPTNGPTPGLLEVVLPAEVYAHSANHLADIRVVDDRGAEVPYAFGISAGQSRVEQRRTSRKEQSFAPGEFTQFVLDAGVAPEFYNAILVNTPETDFITWTEVAVSDDAREWRIVCDRAPLYRFAKDGLQGTQTLHFSDTNARYIRLRILEGAHRFPISSVEVLYDVSTPVERVDVPVSVEETRSTNPRESVWRANLPAEMPLDEVHFETDQSEFSRSVSVEFSDDGNEWTNAGNGEIYRFHRDDVLREWLQVDFGDFWSSHWRIRVVNGSNTPLAGVKINFDMTLRRIVFRPIRGRTYFLMYGNNEAKAPQYDLERTLRVNYLQNVPTATLGAEQTNMNYEDPRPWSERHPATLWIAVIIAAGLLGTAALRSLRSSS